MKLITVILCILLTSCEVLPYRFQQELYYNCKLKPDIESNALSTKDNIATYYICIKLDCNELNWN